MCKSISSHVQIPKSILKSFSFREKERLENNKIIKRDFVYCLDLCCQTIKKEDIKELNAVKGYYSPEMEVFLDSSIEQPLGEIMKNAKCFYKDKIDKFDFDSNAVRNFACYAFLRGKLIINIANEPNVFTELLNALGYSTNKTHEDILRHPKALLGAFDKFDVTVFENHSEIGLVAPRNCIYNTEYKDRSVIWVIPFSPKLAFMLTDKKSANCFEEGAVLNSTDEELIRTMNRHALECEIKTNNEFIISKSIQELEELIPHINHSNINLVL
jgi:hypothetical protein